MISHNPARRETSFTNTLILIVAHKKTQPQTLIAIVLTSFCSPPLSIKINQRNVAGKALVVGREPGFTKGETSTRADAV